MRVLQINRSCLAPFALVMLAFGCARPSSREDTKVVQPKPASSRHPTAVARFSVWRGESSLQAAQPRLSLWND
jgi:hypothetical protein